MSSLLLVHCLVGSALLRRKIREGQSLQVVRGESHFAGAAAEEDALGPLPRLTAEEEDDGLNEDNSPFPGDGRVLEDLVVQHGNV